LQATNLLPASYTGDDVGRATSGAAYGFLTKLYVYQEQWAKAITAGSKITTDPTYKLADNFADNFTLATENNPEVLYGLQYETGWTTDNSPAWYHTPEAWRLGFHEPIQDW